MKSIAIVGSNLIGLLSADILSSKNNVTIIDSELELGFPASFPGSCIDKDVISNILGDQDKNNLFMYNKDNTYNFRSEWFTKLLTHKLAKKDIEIYNRTRIISVEELDRKLSINTSGNASLSEDVKFDIIIDFSNISYTTFGNSTHNCSIKSPNLIQPNIKTKQFFVGICLKKDAILLDNFEIYIERSDDLVEIWYNLPEKQFPKQGWIESKIVNSYYDSRLMILDDYYKISNEIASEVNNI